MHRILADSREPLTKILTILKSFHIVETKTLQHINMTHSFLGALRNFCVSPNSRSDVLKHDVIATIIPFIDYENLDVKAKALIIVRLLVKTCTENNGLELIFADKTLESIEKISLDETTQHHTVIGKT